MDTNFLHKRLSSLGHIRRTISKFLPKLNSQNSVQPHTDLQRLNDDNFDLEKLSDEELFSLMRHESHRIEKAVYNNILYSKKDIYYKKWQRVGRIHRILEKRGCYSEEPTLVWSKQIYDNFDTLEESFVQKNSLPPSKFELEQADKFISFLRSRRSIRVWADKQPDESILKEIAYYLIDAARWAPNTGNRQPWRFLILTKPEEKELLKIIKEEHCINAPLLIFVGINTRVYGALGNAERGIFIDAGASIMQMVLTAHKCGLGVSWNHFADDLINSREINKKIYANFTAIFNIPEYIAPVAVLSIGLPKFIPPEPARMTIEDLMINS